MSVTAVVKTDLRAVVIVIKGGVYSERIALGAKIFNILT